MKKLPLVLFVAGGPEFSRPPFFYLIAAIFELLGTLTRLMFQKKSLQINQVVFSLTM
jgi:hypothetical protein